MEKVMKRRQFIKNLGYGVGAMASWSLIGGLSCCVRTNGKEEPKLKEMGANVGGASGINPADLRAGANLTEEQWKYIDERSNFTDAKLLAELERICKIYGCSKAERAVHIPERYNAIRAVEVREGMYLNQAELRYGEQSMHRSVYGKKMDAKALANS